MKAIFLAEPRMGWVNDHDADLQAPKPEAEEQARFQGQNEYESGPKDSQSQTPQRPPAVGGDRRLEIESMGEAHPHQGPSQRYRLPPSSRITRTRELRGLLRTGKKKKTSHVDVFFLSSGLPRSRVGVIVPKHGFRVVDRNLLKRRLREVLRREILPRLARAETPVDVLVRTRRTAYMTTYQQLRKELVQATEELWSRPSS